MARCTITFVRNDNGDQEAITYIKTLARRQLTGRFEASDLFLAIGALESSGPADEHEKHVVDDEVDVYLLRYDVHVVAYSPHPQDATTVFVLTAFHERHLAKGRKRAEELVRLLFNLSQTP